MSKKKNANIERNTLKKKETHELHKKLENILVRNVGIALVLAMIFTIFHNYKNSSLVGTMYTIFEILTWVGVAAVLVFAILGVVLKKPSLYKWCGIGALNALVWPIFYKVGHDSIGNAFNKGFSSPFISGEAFCYYGLLAFVIFTIIYYVLAYKGLWNKKPARIAFYVLAALVTLVLIVVPYIAIINTMTI